MKIKTIKAENKGFSLIELLVAMAIVISLSVTFILNFRPSAQNQTVQKQAAALIISDIRSAESKALSGSRYKTNLVCGYGVHYVDSSTYLIYAKTPPAPNSTCFAGGTRNYRSNNDFLVETKNIFSTNVVFNSAFSDIYFESPDPKIYINNDSSLTATPTQITLKLKSQTVCLGGQCTTVTVYTSGQLDLQ